MPEPLPLPDPPLAHGDVALRPWCDDDLDDLLVGARDRLVHRYRYSLPDDAEQADTWLAAVRRNRLAGWSFAGLRLGRLSLTVEVENLASRRVAERCGFHCEGRLRSRQLLRDGTRADVLVYGLLAGEVSSD